MPMGNMGHMGEDEKGFGGMFGVVIIVALLIVGGFYFMKKDAEYKIENMTPEEIMAQEDTAKNALNTQGTSDEMVAIEADLQATNTGNLDTEVSAIETELAY